MTCTLYYTPRSPYARKVRIVLAEKQIPCDLQETDIKNKSPEFLALSPLGKIPVLVDEAGLVFWDSTLIVEYLDETYPDPPLYPRRDRREWLRCRQGEELADTLIDHVVGRWIEARQEEAADAAVEAQHQTVIDRLMGVLEQQLNHAPYLLNDRLSAVDVAAFCGLGYYTFRFGPEWQPSYPQLRQWFERLRDREAMVTTQPTL